MLALGTRLLLATMFEKKVHSGGRYWNIGVSYSLARYNRRHGKVTSLNLQLSKLAPL